MKNQENKKTWLNRLEKNMSTFTFEFNTKDLRYKWLIEKKKVKIDGIDQECFTSSIYLYTSGCCSQTLIRQTKEALNTVDRAIDQINKFFADNFFSENICKF